MKSRAMVLEKFNKPLVLREFDIPKLKEGEILVKLEAAAVCGSDVHMWKGEDQRLVLPIILGHEGVGKIVEVKGEKSTVDGCNISVGDSILWDRGVPCGKCFACLVLKEPSLCQFRKVYGIEMGKPTELKGCYSEYIVLDSKTHVFKIPNNVDRGVLVSASCAGATVAHGFDLIKESLIGETVVVQGAGPLGAYAVAFASSLGAKNIIVISGSEFRLNLCKKFGATCLLNRKKLSKKERKKKVKEIGDTKGVSLVVEAAGVHGVVEEGIKFLRSGGIYLSMGFAQPAGREEIDFFEDVVSKNIRIQGVWVSDVRHTKQAMDLVLNNLEKFKNLVTHRLKLEDANQAITLMERKEAMKAILVF